MTPQELRDLCALRGIQSRVKGNEVQIKVCTFCSNEKWNLEINPRAGVLHAWCCGARGRADRFIRDHLGRNVTIALDLRTLYENRAARSLANSGGILQPLHSDWALKYLLSRGLDNVDLLSYEIAEGQPVDPWLGRVVFPLRDYWEPTKEVGYLGRAALPTIAPKYYAGWVDGMKHIGGYRAMSPVHVVTEGVFDAIKVHKAGFNAAVIGGVHESHIEEWAARVPPAHRVVVFLDGDADEQSQKLYWRVYPVHTDVARVRLPAEYDAGMLEPAVIHELVRRARP